MICKRRIILQLFVLFQLNDVCCSQINHEHEFPEILHKLADKIHASQDIIDKLSSYFKLQSIMGNDFKSAISNLFTLLEKQFTQNQHISESQCLKDLTYMLVSSLSGEYWALSMLDSSAKLASGILEGNIYWPGSSNECRRIKVKRNTTNGYNGELSGKYCGAILQPNKKAVGVQSTIPLLLRIDVCVPDSCSPDDLRFLFNGLSDFIGTSDFINLLDLSCFMNNNLWGDKEAVLCLATVCLFISMMVVGTIYDVFYYQSVKYSSSSLNNSHLKTGDSQSLSEAVDLLNDEEYNNGVDSYNNNDAKVEKYSSGKKQIGIYGKILLCFSVYTNSAKIFNLSPGIERVQCLNGIRLFSMTWIISGHTCLLTLIFVQNRTFFFDVKDTFAFQLANQGSFAVDSFFVLSGLLVAYFFCKHYEEKNGKISWKTFYFYRFWRLSPVYILFLILFEKNLSYYIADSPIWNYSQKLKDNCDKSWWWNVLYINNFMPSKDMCMQHSWYMANDMQFYILSPLILIPLVKKSVRFSVSIIGAFLLTSSISSGVLAYYYQIPAILDFFKILVLPEDFYKDVDVLYDKPYCRIGPYVIGLICGWLLNKTKCQFKMKKHWVILCWILAFACNLSVIFGFHHIQSLSSLYLSLSRIAWSLGLAWLIFACCTGYGGIINSILSWPVWGPFSRLTYSVFLIQVLVFKTFYLNSEHFDYFTYFTVYQHILAFISILYVMGLVVSLMFESPFMAMANILFKRS